MNEEIRLVLKATIDEICAIKHKAGKPDDFDAIEAENLKLKGKVS